MSVLNNSAYIALKANSEIQLQKKIKEKKKKKKKRIIGKRRKLIQKTWLLGIPECSNQRNLTAFPQMFNRAHFTTLQFKRQGSTPDLGTDKMDYNLSRASTKSIPLCQLFT